MYNPKRSISSYFILSDESIKFINSFDMYLKELVFLIFQDIRSGASAWSFDSEVVKGKLGTKDRFDNDVSRIMSICYNEDDLEEKIQSLLDRTVGFDIVKTAYLFTTIWNPSYKKIITERAEEFTHRELTFVCFYVTEDLLVKVLTNKT